MTTARYGRREVELPAMVEDPRTGRFKMVRGHVDGRPEGRKVPRATDPSDGRPGTPRPHGALKGAGSAGPAPAPTLPVGPRYRSKLEAFYAAHLAALKHAGEIRDWKYEAIKLYLAIKTSYTPDFLVRNKQGHIELHEVKGYMREDANLKLKLSAKMFPEFIFVLVKRNHGHWDSRKVAT